MSQDDQDRINELKAALSRMTLEAEPTITDCEQRIDLRQLQLDFDLSSISTISLDSNMISALTTEQITALDWSSAIQPTVLSGSSGSLPYTMPGAFTTEASSKITLKGDQADIEINGRSLTATIDSIERRLAILRPNTELEQEWQELQELGQRYRELEQEIQAKSETFNALRQKSPSAR
jgi:hypothetical protein